VELEEVTLPPAQAGPYLGLLAAGLFGMAGQYPLALFLLAVFGSKVAFPGAFALELDPLGFSYRPLLHRHRYAWREVRGFRVRTFRLLGVTLAKAVVFETTRGELRALPESFRMEPEALAAFLNRYRATALQGEPDLDPASNH